MRLQNCHFYNMKCRWKPPATYSNVPLWKSMVSHWPRVAPWSPGCGCRAADGKDVPGFVLSGYRVRHCTRDVAELVWTSFLPEVRSREIVTKIYHKQHMVSDSLPGFFILDNIDYLGRLIVAQALMTQSWAWLAWSALPWAEEANLLYRKGNIWKDSHSSTELVS